ncbi:MAG: TIR domain-containing protein [Candidatus Aminicenantes bacterium]|nr:TIR domain-containing protein [Candidatus Aminicenantes bacterium]NIM83586.1 TIR domain-containing protein [Candidatus Aminicenantes bacterium]NIN22988.1 TIR domain-containing protein [Candidatus Aminicenantes bacterium]NIN46725.1 TIR domain-containing protein [Candidatus Aminicenantes bacterium]NIN89631.1 TIR domain-containing protein [Candidatus Aminicenantes bacterium]
MAKVFISYSHKDEEWKGKLTAHLKVLEMEGYCTLWDDRKIKEGDEWFPGIEKALNEAQIVIMMISAHFLTSNFIRKEEVPRILDRRMKEGVRVIPFIVKPCAWKTVRWLAALQVTPKDGEPLSTRQEAEIDRVLANFAERIASLLKQKEIKEPEIHFLPLPPEHISISKLPTTGEKFFGREGE